uniref:SOWAHA-C winged helix-turn-helix domain-containing protein n=1 Tax=Cyprinodon variegatus TaxID=28743 RepID=A0A3Q2CL69_CYPVA
MATDFTLDSVLVFLQSCGGSVRNSDLLLHFRPFLREHPDHVRNRELFKKFVNSVATVTKIDGVSNVVLRKKYRGHVPGEGALTEGADLLPVGATGRRSALPAAGIMEADQDQLENRSNMKLHQLPTCEAPPIRGSADEQPAQEPQLSELGNRPGPSPPGETLLRDRGRQTAAPAADLLVAEPSPPPVILVAVVLRYASPLPLDANEHAWMVKGAAGAWPDIYTLFRDDASLLNKQDFISGFTVLHWIAKHGDHRVLNTLYGVEQKGLTFDIDAKSMGGQTPLHIAAIHGHKNIIRLLVKKFGANVKLRDMAGKKPWQYLSDRSPDILQLLGAPPKAALVEEAGRKPLQESEALQASARPNLQTGMRFNEGLRIREEKKRCKQELVGSSFTERVPRTENRPKQAGDASLLRSQLHFHFLFGSMWQQQRGVKYSIVLLQ